MKIKNSNAKNPSPNSKNKKIPSISLHSSKLKTLKEKEKKSPVRNRAKGNKILTKNKITNSNTHEKYVFMIDIDDTLVPAGENKIEKNIIDEITRLKKKGHVFVISTGRSLYRVFDIVGIEVFDYIACLMGSEIYSCKEKKVIKYPKSLDEKEVLKLVDVVESHHLSWGFKDDKNDNSYCDDKSFLKRHLAIKRTRAEFEKELSAGRVYQLLINKYITDEEMAQFKQLKFFKMPSDYTDVTDKDSSKKVAVNYFKQMFKNKKIVAIGDSANDIDMLISSDISIAMGNATEDIKRLTTYTTKDITENGLIFAFNEILKL